MTKKNVACNVDEIKEVKEVLLDNNDFLRKIIQKTVQEMLEAEMDETLGAGRYERTDHRVSYRSGYYGRNLRTRVGMLELRVPQDRNGLFSTEKFSRYQRGEKALVTALMEMYIQGVSTRKVSRITEELCGTSYSASTVSDLAKRLDADLEAFARRRLDQEYPYLILDTRYEKVRIDGIVQSQAVLVALGVNMDDLEEHRKARSLAPEGLLETPTDAITVVA